MHVLLLSLVLDGTEEKDHPAADMLQAATRLSLHSLCDAGQG